MAFGTDISVQMSSLTGNTVVEGQGIVYKITVENKSEIASEKLVLGIFVDPMFVFFDAEYSVDNFDRKSNKWSIGT